MVAGHIQQKKGYWYIVLNLHDACGKRRAKWIATHLPVKGNKRKAEEMLQKVRREYSDRDCRGGKLTFDQYMLQWLESMEKKVSPTTYRGYQGVVKGSICPYFREKHILLTRLRAADIEAYYDMLRGTGIKENTILHHHANIHKALEDAVRRELIEINPADAVERPRKEKFLPNYYSAEEANLLLKEVRGNWMELPILLCMFYGLRRSEALGLQWKSVDFTNNIIVIQHARVYGTSDGANATMGRDILKRKSSYRTLPLPEELGLMLQKIKRERFGDGEAVRDCYVCLNQEGKPIAPNYFSQCFKEFLRAHGLREIRLHDLRHTCASLLIQSRIPLIEVQQWLGHSTLETTADLYAHLEYETKLDSAEKLKKI